MKFEKLIEIEKNEPRETSDPVPFVYQPPAYIPAATIEAKPPPEFSAELVYKPPHDNPDLHDETTPIGKKYKKALSLTTDTIKVKRDEKSPRKVTKKSTAKVPAKANKPAVESV